MRLHGRVRHVAVEIGLFHHAHSQLFPIRQVAALSHHLRLRPGFQQVVEDGSIVLAGRRRAELRFQKRHGFIGHVAPLVQHGHQVVIFDHANAGDLFGRARIHARQRRAVRRRPQDPRMQ